LGLIEHALEDDSVDVLFASRGGYGAMRILDRLNLDKIREANKPLVGFSDVTALHCVWSAAGIPSLHGPMLKDIARMSESAWQTWCEVAESGAGVQLSGLHTITGGNAVGHLQGGNLSLLCALAATPYLPALDGCVLLLEDVGEAPYRIDRMLTSLRLAGWWQRVSAVIVGELTDSHEDPYGVSAEEVIAEHFSRTTIPVVTGAPVGHSVHNIPLWLGCQCTVDAEHGTASFASLAESNLSPRISV